MFPTASCRQWPSCRAWRLPGAPASWTALDDVTVMQQAIEHRGDRGVVAEQLDILFAGAVDDTVGELLEQDMGLAMALPDRGLADRLCKV